MAATEVALCNAALDKLGQDPITALSDTSKRAKLCNRNYAILRDKLVRSYLWNFAIAREALTEDATAPAFEFDNRFILPTDMLRAIKPYNSTTEWKIEGGYLLTNDSSVNLIYIKQVTDTTAFDTTFDEAFAYLLAAEMAYPLVQSVTLAERLKANAEMVLKDARSFDAQEGSPQSFDADEWLVSRENTYATSGMRQYYW